MSSSRAQILQDLADGMRFVVSENRSTVTRDLAYGAAVTSALAKTLGKTTDGRELPLGKDQVTGRRRTIDDVRRQADRAVLAIQSILDDPSSVGAVGPAKEVFDEVDPDHPLLPGR